VLLAAKLNQSYTSAVALVAAFARSAGGGGGSCQQQQEKEDELCGDCLAGRLFRGNGKKLDSNSAVKFLLVGVRIASLLYDTCSNVDNDTLSRLPPCYDPA
jgi:hypothetical protein